MKPTHLSIRAVPLTAALAAIAFTITPTRATVLTWDANAATAGQTDGLGSWLDPGQWWNGTANVDWTSGDDAVIGNGGAGGAVSLASPTTVNSLTFNYFTGTYALGTAGQAITLQNGLTKNAGPGILAFAGPVTLGAAQVWTNNSSAAIQPSGAQTLNNGDFDLTLDGSGNFLCSPSAGNTLAISGAGGLIKNGTGHVTLDSNPTVPHSFTGNIVVNGGSIGFQTAAVLAGKNTKLTNGYLGGRFGSSFTWSGGLGTEANKIQITGGVSGLSGEGNSGSTFQIGTAGSTLVWGASGEGSATGFFNPAVFLANGDARMNTNGKGSLNNGIDLNGATRTITSLQTTDGAATSGFTISGAISDSLASGAGLIKTGVGNLILTAANTYNGPTTISAGSITLSGNGTINSTSALNLGGGTLRLINTAQVNRFADGAPITSNGGGISYENTSGANDYTETIGAVTHSAGQLNIVEATNQAGTGSQTLTLSGLTRNGLSAVTFSAGGTGPQTSGSKNMIVVTGAGTTAAGEIIGPWATAGMAANAQRDYAVYSGDHVTSAGIAATGEETWSSTTGNYSMDSSAGIITLSGTRNIASLRNTVASARTISTVNATTELITAPGHGLSVDNEVVFGAGAPGGLTAGTKYYVLDDGLTANDFKVSTTVGGTAVNLTSAGTANNEVAPYAATNSQLALASGSDLGTYGILNGSTFAMNIAPGTGGRVTLPAAGNGALHVNTGSSSITIQAPIIDPTGGGELALVKNGSAGALILNSASTYTGGTVINAGTLQLGTNGSANGANLGGGTYAGSISIAGGATFSVQTNASQTLSGVISGNGNVVKSYSGTLTLSGANTYTGKTSLTPLTTAGAGTLIVTSFNSVNGGNPPMASSSLGRPTTVASGTIDIGSASVQAGGILRYTGPGETTDRVINFPFNGNGAGKTIDASGTGLLKFTSTFTANGSANNDITLTGTGSGEIVGGLPFAFRNFTKSGASTWTLGGPIGNSGTTTISGGSLFLNGNSAAPSGAISVSANATVGGTGTVGGNTTIAAGGILEFNLKTAAASHDRLEFGFGKTLTFAGDSVLTITSSGGAAPGTYTLLTAQGGIFGSVPADVRLPAGWTADPPQISVSGNDLLLTITSTGVAPGMVDHFVISTISSPQTVGSPITGITITAQDASNATATGFTGTVTFGGTGGFSGNSASFTFGTLTGVSLTPTVSGSNLTLTVDDGSGHTGSTIIATIQSAYQAWSGGAAPNDDANSDSVKNAVAWALGATDPSSNATALLPSFDNTSDPEYFIFVYRRSDAANTAPNSVVAQYGTTTGAWTTAVDDGSNVIITASNDFYAAGVDKVQVKLKRSTLAPGGKLFARLHVTVSP